METCKSEEPYYTPAIKAFLSQDCPRLLGIPPSSFSRDILTLEKRLAHEGEAFLTKTLPALGKQIDRALQGHVPLTSTSFKKVGRSALPAFLQALHRRVFLDTGWLADRPCIIAIKLLRQICNWCKKIEKGYSDEALQKATADFIQVDKALPEVGEIPPSGLLGVARAIIEHLFDGIPPLNTSGAMPRHGPGAVASGDDAVEKRSFHNKYLQLESFFRPVPWFFSVRDTAEDHELVTNRRVSPYGLSRTEFVNKDSSGPRTISLMPSEYMWVQQAMKQWLYDWIQWKSPASGHINFTDQEVNRNLALLPRDWETLDMSKASDRNSLALVMVLFETTQRVLRPLLASRTPATVLPDGRTYFHKSFAPMGSAVCFPVEACVFYALAVAVLHLEGMPLKLAMRSAYVYGDDLVVPRGYYPALDKAFTAVGLKFNADKCCTEGLFRESCGMDAFDGESVTPIRLKKAYAESGMSILSSLVRHANNLMSAGYRAAARGFRQAVESYYNIPAIGVTHRDDLPIISWLDEAEPETLVYRTRDGITQVKGWAQGNPVLDCPLSGEASYLRESLCLGGPVGEWRSKRETIFNDVPDDFPRVPYEAAVPGTHARVLGQRYESLPRKKWWSCVRTYH